MDLGSVMSDQSTIMLTTATGTVTTIPILELRVLFDKSAAIPQVHEALCGTGCSLPRMEKMVCELNADIYGKGFFGMKRINSKLKYFEKYI
jgi:hypothetical protein